MNEEEWIVEKKFFGGAALLSTQGKYGVEDRKFGITTSGIWVFTINQQLLMMECVLNNIFLDGEFHKQKRKFMEVLERCEKQR